MTNAQYENAMILLRHIESNTDVEGLTKREYFAALAMQGMCVGRKLSESPEMAITNKAVKFADALIDALNKEN